MVRKREGFHTATIDFPDELWEALRERAQTDPEAAGSVSRLVCLFAIVGLEMKLAAPKPRGRPKEAKPKRPRKP